MILHVSKNSSSNEVEHISFPADAGKVRYAMIGLEEFGGWAPAHIVWGEGPAQCLTGYISRDDLYSEDGVEKLNRLAGLVDTMELEAQKVFAGALRAESINGLDDVLRVASSLGQYEFIEGVTTDKELGGWLVEHGKAGVDFPREVWPYLDYAGIGRSYYADHGRAYTPSGYVKRREVIQTQKAAKRPNFALTLSSSTGSVHLNLPTGSDELELDKAVISPPLTPARNAGRVSTLRGGSTTLCHFFSDIRCHRFLGSAIKTAINRTKTAVVAAVFEFQKCYQTHFDRYFGGVYR